MSIIGHFRSSPAAQPPEQATAPAAGGLPIPRYDRLGAKEVAARLSQLTQIELKSIEAHERAHQNRPIVLDKLRYLLTVEPLPGYDTLEPDHVIEALQGADGQTLRAVRDYERKFRRRQPVSAAIAEMLPTSHLSESERQAKAEKDERVRSRPEPGTQP